MVQGVTGTGGGPEKEAGGTAKDEAAAGGNSLKDASDEAARFMEEGDEPGHAGRGDAG
jgi:hypothetical protein